MAPTENDVDFLKTNPMKNSDEINDKDNLWTSILSEVEARGNNKLPTNKAVLVLGDNSSGKTTLVAKLQGVERPTKGSGLEYAYIDVRDEYRDDATRLSVWILDGDPGHLNLLKFSLSERTYPHTLVMLVASMTNPCNLLDQLQMWSNIIHDHLRSLKLNADLERECRHKCIKKWHEYSESNEDNLKRSSRNLDDDELLPLQENVLTMNYGLDIVVVITKTDYMTQLEKEYDYREEHFDFIQYHLRNFCLQHGAALFYTSAKEDKNCDVLYKYLTHKIYGVGPAPPALIVEKDAVLVPAGWDQANKIAILTESMHNIKPDQHYRDVIVAPQRVKYSAQTEVEVQADDDQAFLSRLLNQLQAGSADGLSKLGGERRGSPGVPAGGGAHAPGKKLDGKTSAQGEGVLANFFNSLLAKKAPGSPSATAKPEDVTTRVDAAAELERLSQSPVTTIREGGLNDSSSC